jgi:hypothetical protein
MTDELACTVQDYVELFKRSKDRTEEAWKRDYEEAQKVWQLEEWVRCGNFLLQFLDQRVKEWRSAVASGQLVYSEKFNDLFLVALRLVIDSEEIIRHRISEFQGKGYCIDGAEDLLAHVQKMRRMRDDWVPPILSRARGQHVWEMTQEEAEELDRLIESGEAKVDI